MYTETEAAFQTAVRECRALFLGKAGDYGSSWLLFRLPSLTDSIFIKARRIRQLEEMDGLPAVPEDIDAEYQGIFNYAVMALIRLWHAGELPPDLLSEGVFSEVPLEKLMDMYDRVTSRLHDLMLRKNHDYGEAWRTMRPSSYTDQILVRVWRLKRLEDKGGRTAVSEGADANYADIANYCIFALIRLLEGV